MLDCASWVAAGSAAAMLEGARRAAGSKGAGAAEEQEAEQSGADVSETHTTLTLSHTHIYTVLLWVLTAVESVSV